MADLSLKVLLFGEDRSASKTIKGLGEEANSTSKRVAAGAVVAAAAIVAFGAKSISTYGSVGSESLKLQRYMGGTIEDASRLRFAGTQSGVGVDTLTTSMGKLSRTLVTSSGSAKSTAAMTALLGFSVKDAAGKMLPMSELLPKLADKFKAMPAGAEKTALAVQLFGKRGMEMLPMLNKGSEGLKALSAESDKFGETLNTKDTAAVKENVKQKRLMSAAVEGLQIMLGRVLMPAVVAVTTTLASLAGWFTKNIAVLGPLLTIVGSFVAIIFTVTKAMKAWAAIQAVMNLLMVANPIGLVIVAIALLVGAVVLIATKTTWFQTIWKAMTDAIGAAWKAIWNGVLQPVIGFILTGFADLATMIGKVLVALGNIPGFGWAKTAGEFMLNAAAGARKLASDIKQIPDKTVTITIAEVYTGGRSAAKGIGGSGGMVAGNAAGTSFFGGGLSWVGEQGPELVSLPRGSVINSNANSMAMARDSMAMARGDTSATSNSGKVILPSSAEVVKAIKALGDRFGAELDRQARTIQTMQRAGAR